MGWHSDRESCQNWRDHEREAERDAQRGWPSYEHSRWGDDPCSRVYYDRYDEERRAVERRAEEREAEERAEARHAAEVREAAERAEEEAYWAAMEEDRWGEQSGPDFGPTVDREDSP